MTRLPYPDPPLEDEAIRLRPWSEADLPAVHAATQDPLIPRFTRVPEQQSEAAVREYFEGREPSRHAGEQLGLAIADSRSDTFLGTIGLLRIEWPERRCEVGYWLAPWGRGRGAATRAVRLLSRWALSELGLARLSHHAFGDNEASQRVAERSGYKRDGVLRSAEEHKGRRVDLVVYSLLPGDLRKS